MVRAKGFQVQEKAQIQTEKSNGYNCNTFTVEGEGHLHYVKKYRNRFLSYVCYEKWGFGTWVTLRQYTTHSFYFNSNRKTILTNFFLSLLPTLFNRRSNNSICCTWLEPGMRKLWMMSLPGIWPLKSSRSSHGRARLELQWSGRYRRPPVQTRVGLPSQHVKSFLVA